MKYTLAAQLALPLLLFSCGRAFEPSITNIEPVDERISSIEIREYSALDFCDVIVDLRVDVFESGLIKERVFGPFWTSITLEEARDLAGPPDRVSHEGKSGEAYHYVTEHGEIEVVYLDVGSWETHMSYQLLFHPTRSTPTELFASSLISEVKERRGEVDMTVLDPDGLPGLSLSFEDGALKSIHWIRDHRTASRHNRTNYSRPARTERSPPRDTSQATSRRSMPRK